MNRILFLIWLLLGCGMRLYGQGHIIRGAVKSAGHPVWFANVSVPSLNFVTTTDSLGRFELKEIPAGAHVLQVNAVGYKQVQKQVQVSGDQPLKIQIIIQELQNTLEEVVISGTLKEVSRSESPVPVEIITPKLFQKNPTPSLFDALGLVNGVQPQLNCNVCNTGDIHINGMEGPYTLVLIDGMPIVSALGSVYGLSGIPTSLVERIEVVKGPAGALYGSEAMGGVINVITKRAVNAPRYSLDVFLSSWQELSADASFKYIPAKNTTGLLGVNYFNYQNPIDRNADGFTDLTLQHRLSVFHKLSFQPDSVRVNQVAMRYVYEDRWGGQTNWSAPWRGTDSIYGESIYTNRVEVLGTYQWASKYKLQTQYSYNWHHQNSYYGQVPYMATQHIGFVQTYGNKTIAQKHDVLAGISLRYTYYDDNTPGTLAMDGFSNSPTRTPLPGLFLQDEWKLNDKWTALTGYRLDYDHNHGFIQSPRIALKWKPHTQHTFRASAGTGFRVVNLFTEDHAALTGAREVIIEETLKPERSVNGTLNYSMKVAKTAFFAGFDVSAFYAHFSNKIVGDFDSNPNQIVYKNLQGYAVSRGVSVNTDWVFTNPFKLLMGLTFQDVFINQQLDDAMQVKTRQLHAPKWSGNFVLTYAPNRKWVADLTGNWNAPMRLPILPNDFRPEYSPWFCIANIQLTRKDWKGLDVYVSVKNLFNFVPKNPILRAFDPFDKQVNDPVANPNGYTFDPTYNYASLQGIRLQAGVRFLLY